MGAALRITQTGISGQGDQAGQAGSRALPGQRNAHLRSRGFCKAGLLAGLIAIAQPAVAKDKPEAPVDFGTSITYRDAVAQGEAYILNRLIDPESARFRWPWDMVQGWLKPLFMKRQYGYWTCGVINARNRMGGYTGDAVFYIMFRDGKVTLFEMDNGSDIRAADATCSNALKKGILQAAPETESRLPVTDAQALGIRFQRTELGALLLHVEPGTPAAVAGLKPGQLIATVNSIPLKGLSEADMTAILQAPASRVALSLVGGGEVVVNRSPLVP